MKLQEYIQKVFNTALPLDLFWVTLAFTHVKTDQSPKNTSDYCLRIISGQYEYFFQGSWYPLQSDTKPLLNAEMPITVLPGNIVNIKKPTDTTVGRLLANNILVSSIFGDRIEYINQAYQISDVVKKIMKDVVDDEDYIPNENFSMSQYLLLCDRNNYITTLSKIFFTSPSIAAFVQPAWVKPYREQLYLQYKDELHKPETIAKIDNLLVQRYMQENYDKQTAKFITNKGKQIDNSIKKLLLSYGAEITTLGDSREVQVVPQSLGEGIDPKYLVAMYNAQRSGSYARGAETQFGGVSVKESLGATQNFTVQDNDCGTKRYMSVELLAENKKDYIGTYAVINNKSVEIDEQLYGKYLGKSIQIRTPLYCAAEHTTWCVYCLGKNMTVNKNNLSVNVMGLSSSVMGISMAAAHSKALKLVTLDIKSKEVFI